MSSTIKSYFERKRRDLSDKPNNQREKKIKGRAAWTYC